MWSVSTILTGVLSFMLEETPTTGALAPGAVSDEQRRQLAAQSMETNLRDPVFCKHFPDVDASTTTNSTSAATPAEPSATELKQQGNEAVCHHFLYTASATEAHLCSLNVVTFKGQQRPIYQLWKLKG